MLDIRRASRIFVFGLLLVPAGWAQTKPAAAELVDATRLVEAVGEENVRLRITIPKAILAALSGAGGDPEIGSVVSGLESMNAVILDLSNAERAARARKAARDLEADLRGKGWEELAYVQEEGATVRVLVRTDGESKQIRGLVVLVIDTTDDEPALVFANVTGTIDLAKLQQIGQGLNVPGLSDLNLK